jgi:hypothetical protein
MDEQLYNKLLALGWALADEEGDDKDLVHLIFPPLSIKNKDKSATIESEAVIRDDLDSVVGRIYLLPGQDVKEQIDKVIDVWIRRRMFENLRNWLTEHLENLDTDSILSDLDEEDTTLVLCEADDNLLPTGGLKAIRLHEEAKLHKYIRNFLSSINDLSQTQARISSLKD